MTSQLVIFRAFLFIFFRPPDPRSEKNSHKSSNKKDHKHVTNAPKGIGLA